MHILNGKRQVAGQRLIAASLCAAQFVAGPILSMWQICIDRVALACGRPQQFLFIFNRRCLVNSPVLDFFTQQMIHRIIIQQFRVS